MDLQQQQAQPQTQEYLIKSNKYIVLVDNRNDRRLLKINQNKNFRWRKIPVKLQLLNKFQYYQKVQVGNNKLTLITQQPSDDEEEDNEQVRDHENNKQIYTLSSTQKLQQEQIKNIKNSSDNAQQIINTIVNNNEQFSKRTAYSKQKYIQKKKKKYQFHFHAEPVSLENVHNYYYNDDPKAIGFMRWDILAFLLLQASPYKKVFLAEKTKGIILGSLLLRELQSIHLFSQQTKNIRRFPIVEQLNIDKGVYNSKVKFHQWEGLETLQNVFFDNVIIVGYYDFSGILKGITKFMKKGCTVCFFCSVIEPLSEALEVMKQGEFIHIKLFDSWCREYQVLKNRTHPLMSMNSHSGYLLTAFKG